MIALQWNRYSDVQGTSCDKLPARQDWGDARATYKAIREDVMERLAKGHSLSRIYRALGPPLSYAALTYHVRKDREGVNASTDAASETGPAGQEDVTGTLQPDRSPDGEASDDPPSTTPAPIEGKLARLRRLGEKAGHYGKRAVYDPTANTEEDLFGPAKEA